MIAVDVLLQGPLVASRPETDGENARTRPAQAAVRTAPCALKAS